MRLSRDGKRCVLEWLWSYAMVLFLWLCIGALVCESYAASPQLDSVPLDAHFLHADHQRR